MMLLFQRSDFSNIIETSLCGFDTYNFQISILFYICVMKLTTEKSNTSSMILDSTKD